MQKMLLSKFGSRWYLSNEDVEDCVQDTLKRAMLNIEKNPEIRAIGSLAEKYKYIHAVANNLLREKIDQGKTRARRERPLPDDGQIEGPDEDVEEKILSELEQAQIFFCLENCLAEKLSPLERNLIHYHFGFGGRSMKKFSLLMSGFSAGARRVRVHRIIRYKLRPCMERCLKRFGLFAII
jgi:DNA-directed RNA polymerase specialized sigma24 family protein